MQECDDKGARRGRLLVPTLNSHVEAPHLCLPHFELQLQAGNETRCRSSFCFRPHLKLRGLSLTLSEAA